MLSYLVHLRSSILTKVYNEFVLCIQLAHFFFSLGIRALLVDGISLHFRRLPLVSF